MHNKTQCHTIFPTIPICFVAVKKDHNFRSNSLIILKNKIVKKLIFVFLSAVLSTSIFAAIPPSAIPVKTAKILKLSHQNFPEIANAQINSFGNYYMVHFKNEENKSTCNLYYDTNGNVFESIMYYFGEELAPFLRTKIMTAYEGKTISSVTEVSNINEHYYQIILEDSKSLFIIKADDNGSINLIKKFKRAQ